MFIAFSSMRVVASASGVDRRKSRIDYLAGYLAIDGLEFSFIGVLGFGAGGIADEDRERAYAYKVIARREGSGSTLGCLYKGIILSRMAGDVDCYGCDLSLIIYFLPYGRRIAVMRLFRIRYIRFIGVSLWFYIRLWGPPSWGRLFIFEFVDRNDSNQGLSNRGTVNSVG